MAIGTYLFNPFTGEPRRPEDIESDPKGILIWDGEEPLQASKKRPDSLALPTSLFIFLNGLIDHYKAVTNEDSRIQLAAMESWTGIAKLRDSLLELDKDISNQFEELQQLKQEKQLRPVDAVLKDAIACIRDENLQPRDRLQRAVVRLENLLRNVDYRKGAPDDVRL